MDQGDSSGYPSTLGQSNQSRPSTKTLESDKGSKTVTHWQNSLGAKPTINTVNIGDSKNDFGKAPQLTPSAPNKPDISSSIGSRKYGTLRKADEDSYCCYQVDESLVESKHIDSHKLPMKNEMKQSTKDHFKMDDDTCLIGSLCHQKFMSGKKEIPNGGVLKDITNTFFPVQESFSHKTLFSNVNTYQSFQANESLKNLPRYQDSERKNPLDLVFED